MTYEQWKAEFLKRYEARTGITFEAAGGDDGEARKYFEHGESPNTAVSNEIDRYQLTDLEDV